MVKIQRIILVISSVAMGLGLVTLLMIPTHQAQAQTPVPTGTPIAPGIITNTGDLTGLVTIPGPIALPTVTYTLEYSPLWDIDTLTTFYQVIVTMPTFPVIQTFLKIFAAIAAVIIGFKVIRMILGAQTNEDTGKRVYQVGRRKFEI